MRAAIVLPPRADHVPALIPFDSGARKALELTFREALRLGHNYIGTEHMLLALREAEQGGGTLHRVGFDKARAEADIARCSQRSRRPRSLEHSPDKISVIHSPAI